MQPVPSAPVIGPTQSPVSLQAGAAGATIDLLACPPSIVIMGACVLGDVHHWQLPVNKYGPVLNFHLVPNIVWSSSLSPKYVGTCVSGRNKSTRTHWRPNWYSWKIDATPVCLWLRKVKVCVCVSIWLSVVASTYNPSSWEFETKESLQWIMSDRVSSRPAQTTH